MVALGRAAVLNGQEDAAGVARACWRWRSGSTLKDCNQPAWSQRKVDKPYVAATVRGSTYPPLGCSKRPS